MLRPPARSQALQPQDDSVPTDLNGTADQPFVMESLRFYGAAVFSQEDLAAIAGFRPGMTSSVRELGAMAGRVTAAYRSKGYFIAQTYLPPQQITDGAVRMEVIEGRYDRIRLNNTSALRERTAQRLLQDLQEGDTVRLQPLEEALLLLTNLPGVRASSALQAGAHYGSSDLLIDVTPTEQVTGHVDVDNEGNRYSGAVRAGLSLNWNEPAGYGDMASLRLMGSELGLVYGRLAYQGLVGKSTLSGAYTSLDYHLGKEFASAKASGASQVFSLSWSHPLVRSRNRNFYAQAGYDDKSFQDRNVDGSAHKRVGVGYIGASGDYRDGLLEYTVINYTVRLVHGDLELQSPSVRAADALTAQTHGAFDKLEYNLTQQHALSESVSLYAGLNGQIAFKNLDASEKIALGGAAGVRAYPPGESNADSGYVLNLELRKDIAQESSRWRLLGFVDAGGVTFNQTSWAAGTSANTRELLGAGFGLHWIGARDTTLKAFVAWKLGSEDATTAPDEPYRVWLQLVKYF